jgi:flagellar FliL protein
LLMTPPGGLSKNMSDEAKSETPAAAPPKAGGSKVVPILMVMNTLLVGGVLMFVMKKQSPVAVSAPAAAAAEGEHGEAKGEHAEAKGEHGGGEGHGAGGPGPMVKLENFVIQLKAVDSERYVRVAFDLELGQPTDEDAIKNRLSQIRDSIISYFSDRTLDELRGSDGMDHIKSTLLKRLDGIVPGHRIKAIYITDFIIQ